MSAQSQVSKAIHSLLQPGKRIVVVGSSGSGKTTLAETIARKLNIPHIELDALHWQANWQETELEVFRHRVELALEGQEWVLDGNYAKVRDITWGRADTLLWLELPLPVVLWRLTRRTVQRAVSQEELWNGNRENWHEALFSRDSLFLHMLRTRKRHRQDYTQLVKEPEYSHLQVIHLRSLTQVNDWIAQLSRD